MKQFPFLLALVLTLSPMLPLAQASSSSTSSSSSQSGTTADACKQEMVNELGSANRHFRTMLFGQKSATAEPVNAARYDSNGDAWLKATADLWIEPGGRIKTNKDIDVISEWPIRRGIFETREALTSELIPPLTQSYRALGCSLDAICATIGLTQSGAIKATGTGGRIYAQPLGCENLPVRPLASCQKLQTKGDAPAVALVSTLCRPMANAILDREESVVKLSVTYDAAYRSLLQYAGGFDSFIGQFKGDLLTPVEQTVSIIGQLSRIPCFLAECNE